MDMFKIKHFFFDLLELSYIDLKPGWGNPCSYLLERLILHQEPFLNKITGDYTGHSHEMRLNGAGLKLYWEVRRRDGKVEFKVSIGGDQAKEYRFFIVHARRLIKKYGYNKYNL